MARRCGGAAGWRVGMSGGEGKGMLWGEELEKYSPHRGMDGVSGGERQAVFGWGERRWLRCELLRRESGID